MRLGQYHEARDDYTRAAQLEPASGDTYALRGWAALSAEDWKPALEDFDKALALHSAKGDADVGRGLALVMLGHYREAVAQAEAVLRRGPGRPAAFHNIACIFAQAAVRVEADQAEAQRGALAGRYRGQALQAVRQALALLPPGERLPFWQDKVSPDAALDPIRDTAEFKRLEAQYAEPGSEVPEGRP
jgi:tetratricopeptide (TPR) repeat protein